MNRWQTANFIEVARLELSHDSQTITEGIVAFMEEPSYHSGSGRAYTIFLGGGERYTSSPDGEYEPVPDPIYESCVSPNRSLEDDHILAESIILTLKEKFPLLVIKNALFASGSFHEQFADHTFRIDNASLVDQASDLRISVQELLKKIDPIIAERIEKERHKTT